jgi:outer membrane protein insertion porin family
VLWSVSRVRKWPSLSRFALRLSALWFVASALIPARVHAQGAEPAAPSAESTEQPATGTATAPRDATTAGTTPPPALPAPAPSAPTTSEHKPSDQPLAYTLEGIEIQGNTRTRSRVVLRYIPFQAGDVFDVDDPEVELTRYRLLGTGFFRDVQFSLRKGTRRGLVVLVVEVQERNTIIINDFWMGLSADADTQGKARPLTAYGGIDVAETNLLGTGITLGSAVGLAQDQLALRLRFLDPAFIGRDWMTSGTLLYNDARDFFGNAQVRYVDPGQLTRRSDHAVVRYQRFGGSLGVGRDLSISTQVWLHYRLETIDASFPLAASHQRGSLVEPIDFDVVRGRSLLSTLRATFQLDTRDQPFLPTRGWFASTNAELGLSPFGSDYAYERMDLSVSRWWRLPWHDHVLRVGLFLGAIAGDAPFFEQYYVGDFSDFLPTRVLGVNFDARPPPNFLGTQIVEVRYGDYAAKLSGEYRIPLYRGHRSVFGIDLFGSAGLYAVASEREFERPPPEYRGFRRAPIDLTANLGLRMDTSAGGFVFALSNVLGFIPVRGDGPAGE